MSCEPSAWYSARSLTLNQVFERPALRYGEQEDVVGRIVVALDIEAARRLCDDPEYLKRDIAFGQTRYVDVAACAAFKKIAAPQQRIAMQVGDLKRLVQRQRITWTRSRAAGFQPGSAHLPLSAAV